MKLSTALLLALMLTGCAAKKPMRAQQRLMVCGGFKTAEYGSITTARMPAYRGGLHATEEN
jgi:hypothetical protein